MTELSKYMEIFFIFNIKLFTYKGQYLQNKQRFSVSLNILFFVWKLNLLNSETEMLHDMRGKMASHYIKILIAIGSVWNITQVLTKVIF